jgi:hypothetical protein
MLILLQNSATPMVEETWHPQPLHRQTPIATSASTDDDNKIDDARNFLAATTLVGAPVPN